MSLGALLIILANTWLAAAFVMMALEAWWWAAAASGIALAFALMNAGLRVQELRAAAWPDLPKRRSDG